LENPPLPPAERDRLSQEGIFKTGFNKRNGHIKLYNMKRYCLAVDLIDDPELIAGYENRHKNENAWPAITKSITDSGITNMEIYRTGNRLFMIMETADNFSFERKAAMDAANGKVQEWEQLMWTFQQPLAWAKEGEKWVLMKKIFQLPETK
jgi:L-rhamnose mutarotase